MPFSHCFSTRKSLHGLLLHLVLSQMLSKALLTLQRAVGLAMFYDAQKLSLESFFLIDLVTCILWVRLKMSAYLHQVVRVLLLPSDFFCHRMNTKKIVIYGKYAVNMTASIR